MTSPLHAEWTNASPESQHLPTTVVTLAPSPESPLDLLFMGLQKPRVVNLKNRENMTGFPHTQAAGPTLARCVNVSLCAGRTPRTAGGGCVAAAVSEQSAFSWRREGSGMCAIAQQLEKSLKYNTSPQIVIFYCLRLVNG